MKQKEIKLKIQIAAFEGLKGDDSYEPDTYYYYPLYFESSDECINEFD